MNEQTDYKEIGHNIRLSRKQRGMNQRMLANLVNVSPQHISHIEAGQPVSLPVLINISNVLDVSLDLLVGRNLQCSQQLDIEVQRTAMLIKKFDISAKELKKFNLLMEAYESQLAP